jgi:lipoic acid synthetase
MRKPDWLRVDLPSGEEWKRVAEVVERRHLHTVCDSARCPNKAECWGQSTATFMILGAICTRGCRFCAVERAIKGEPVRAEEPAELAAAVAELGLRYAVVTSVDRDDLHDRGAAHFAACIRAIKESDPTVLVEVLIPDYRQNEIKVVLDAGPDVVAHNVETVRRLQGLRDHRASYAASLHTLELAADRGGTPGAPQVKSSIILGLGETRTEVLEAMDDIRRTGCASLVLGQYLRPTKAQIEVVEYLTPEAFADYEREALERGFLSVVSAPLARTSYHARAGYEESGAKRPEAPRGAESKADPAVSRRKGREAR